MSHYWYLAKIIKTNEVILITEYELFDLEQHYQIGLLKIYCVLGIQQPLRNEVH